MRVTARPPGFLLPEPGRLPSSRREKHTLLPRALGAERYNGGKLTEASPATWELDTVTVPHLKTGPEKAGDGSVMERRRRGWPPPGHSGPRCRPGQQWEEGPGAMQGSLSLSFGRNRQSRGAHMRALGREGTGGAGSGSFYVAVHTDADLRS